MVVRFYDYQIGAYSFLLPGDFSRDFSALTNRMEQEKVIKDFEQIVGELKNGVLSGLEEDSGGPEENSATQDVAGKLSDVEDKLGQIHKSTLGFIHESTQPVGGTLDTRSLYALFERKGIFSYLKQNPGIKEDLIRILNILLIEYPFTRSVKHVENLRKSFENTHIHRVEIIPNMV